MVIIYALTMLVSALLLFIVQPMFARMVLPLLGGSPAVWNTAVLFYQAALLLGYLYAHVATRWLGVRRQAMLHIVVLALPLLALPITIPAGWVPPSEENPIPWLLTLLLMAVGLPFFVVSINSPMLQTWFAATRHRSASDPYFLYAMSNLGSMLALLGYPILIEPFMGLQMQSWLWAVGYCVLIILIALCAIVVWRFPAMHAPVASQTQPLAGLPWRRRAGWVGLAFIPSSLMLSVTTYLTTNIAPIPLLWVIPLALYLLSFILVFANTQIVSLHTMARTLPIVLLPLVIVLVAQATQPLEMLIILHLLVFFVVTMVCHGRIAADRPAASHLTEFYLWMSVGGVLGGAFNALLAPMLFNSLAEYPLVLALAALALPGIMQNDTQPTRRWLDLVLPVALGVLTVGLILGVQVAGISGPAGIGLMFGIPMLVCFSFSRNPIRFVLGIGAIMLASMLYVSEQGRQVYAERSFFGVHRVLLDPTGQYHVLAHGGTIHGMQSLDPARRREALTYYQSSGPIGQVFDGYAGKRIAVIGLGSGALACYNRPGQEWTFYEIDRSVVHIAREPRYFGYLQECAPDTNIVVGDARLTLAAAPAQSYDLIVLDAYTSDSIPIHLITREALDMYLEKLAPDGMLAFHISNQYLNLAPVLGNLANSASMVGFVRNDLEVGEAERANGKFPSQWAVLARSSSSLSRLTADSRWRPLPVDPDEPPWTDDYSSVVRAFR